MTSTADERIYAIGDVHGRSDLLAAMLERIAADLGDRPHDRPRIVMLGDYADRGPDSRGVIERLMRLEAEPIATTFLLGNHDAYLLAYLEDPEMSDRGLHWFARGMGGAATLASYGVLDASEAAPAATHDAFVAAFPEAHRAFLHRAKVMEPVGDYLFVHAGIRPGVPLEAQEREDLIWIREPFLSSPADHGVKVVHGHTIVPFVEHHPNRIAVDTGAVKTGVLSCVVLEGSEAALLTGAGPRPLPVGAGRGMSRLGQAISTRMERILARYSPAAQGRGA